MMDRYKTIERSYMLAKKLSKEAQEVISDDVELVNILETMIKRSY
jgi:octaprenyl-diphosphate synthase